MKKGLKYTLVSLGSLVVLAGAALLSSPILSETANAMSCAGCILLLRYLKSYIYNSVAQLRDIEY